MRTKEEDMRMPVCWGGDLRIVFPVLIAMARPYIGKNNGADLKKRALQNAVEMAKLWKGDTHR